MKFIKILFLIYAAIAIEGCATGSKAQDMSYSGEGEALAYYDQALKSQVSILSVKGGRETHPLLSPEVSNQSFSNAVKLSLIKQGLFSSTGRYQLAIDLVALKSAFSLSTTMTSIVKYQLIDSHTSKLLMNETVEATYTATLGESMLGTKRLGLAKEGAINANIQGLLIKLSAIQVSSEDIAVEQ